MKIRLCFGVNEDGKTCVLFGIPQEVPKSTKNCPKCEAPLYPPSPQSTTKKRQKQAMGERSKTNKNTWQNRRVKEGGCRQSYVNGNH